LASLTLIFPRTFNSFLFTLLDMIRTCHAFPFLVNPVEKGEAYDRAPFHPSLYRRPVERWSVGLLSGRPRYDPLPSRLCPKQYPALSTNRRPVWGLVGIPAHVELNMHPYMLSTGSCRLVAHKSALSQRNRCFLDDRGQHDPESLHWGY
jgi:hypothetical protein